MLRVISANLNGIRSANTKGFFDWLHQQNADFVCVQELKAQEADLSPAMKAPAPLQGYFHYAEKKGYSGVGIYTPHEPESVVIGLGVPDIDAEGRYIELVYPKLSVVSVYLPSGSSGDHRQTAKYRFMEHFYRHLADLIGRGREVVICGDWNIAHKEADLKNWKGNLKNSGFLPEERAWLTQVFDELKWVDVYRRLAPDATGEGYTWWSNRGQAWAKNVGWRIDYHIASGALAATAQQAAIYKDVRFSDHAPLTIDYDFSL
ncbi:exodeoxyribonuclease III [Bordetella avium]|uniref:Catabolite repression control protein n=2 Tax=Bordetella avium TaxID=521 RepID=Q2KU69_BORA1|nr:exodeoxyribonuclease III [Bordetella avium]AZY50510.1 exodeoxyribonuclease III [Bordetella avium]AZY53906.1 exodeoxyribonuclease III [Bordetella avium]RIQ15321.1 exodeoxyribonuclease III [Bordetella avium]RIQ19874.1 exodeoxyribonuclease III [Bordetella avium]RIQ34453.1 exodeoxyribonuclease III [Bordetella avium]